MAEIWSTFEKRIISDSRFHGVFVVQIPSEMRKVGSITFRKKTAFDFCAGMPGGAAFFDAKACAEAKFNLTSLVLREKKIHQYKALVEAFELGNKSGYLIWFYKKGLIAWVPVHVVQDLVTRGIKSLDEKTPWLKIQRDDVPINLRYLLGLTDEVERVHV